MSQPVESWEQLADRLEHRHAVPAAQASARLLRACEAEWVSRVVARSSMHDLLFTLIGDDYPFVEMLRVSWEDDVYTFRLTSSHGRIEVAADRCREARAPLVASSFLAQLTAQPHAQ